MPAQLGGRLNHAYFRPNFSMLLHEKLLQERFDILTYSDVSTVLGRKSSGSVSLILSSSISYSKRIGRRRISSSRLVTLHQTNTTRQVLSTHQLKTSSARRLFLPSQRRSVLSSYQSSLKPYVLKNANANCIVLSEKLKNSNNAWNICIEKSCSIRSH